MMMMHEGETGSVQQQMMMQHASVNGVDVMLGISPLQVGFNTFTITLSEGGKPPQNIANVILRFTNQDTGIGPLVVTLQKAGDGIYSTTGGYLSQAGEWKIDFIAQRTGAYDLNYSFTQKLGGNNNTNNTNGANNDNSSSSPQTMPEMSMPTTGNGTTSTGGMQPAFDSFAAIALALSLIVATASAFYAIQSRKQMKRTLAALE
jgi:copper transport protein